jgi:hypothetical protein
MNRILFAFLVIAVTLGLPVITFWSIDILFSIEIPYKFNLEKITIEEYNGIPDVDSV